ncbi:MAG: DNA photolyase family protein [Burkholderiales bacterium]|nr:DNA photolyase family protein [Burkholderiales bacterium]TXG97508.1 MAG: deoxyribodipyrimidine photo-lyase [Nevskiaceae bacterium]
MGCAIVWFRRDLRLDDNPALQAALEAGHVPLPVYIHAPEEEGAWTPGAASRAWLHRSLAALDQALRARGSRLTLLRGPSVVALDRLIASTGAEAVFWNRLYEPAIVARDTGVKQHLRARGLRVASFKAALLCEPWEAMTGQGEPYRVFTPFWRKAAAWLDMAPPRPAPVRLPAPPAVAGERLDDLRLRPATGWDRRFWEVWSPGEAGALELLDAFVEGAAYGYRVQRDFPDRIGTSRLSPHLHFGEISPRRIVARLRRESWPAGVRPDIERYFSELGWREFSHHLLHHFPHTADSNFDPRFDAFGWVEPEPSVLEAWQRGRTSVPIVDAGMRELWVTGWMHNRVRMIVASFLAKNLRIHWRHGARWFWDTLVDADLANNTQGWQWSAGTGADAAPYFRIFNPVRQAQRFDPAGRYIRRWLPELAALPDSAVHAPWEHPEPLRRLAPDYPQAPRVNLKASREAALAAWRAIR